MAYIEPHTSPVLPQAPILKPLESVAVPEGARAVFHCVFKLHGEIHIYAVWSIAGRKVERSSAKYRLIYKGGECLLYIPRIEPSMEGEVKCELRYTVPHEKSIYINSSQAHIVIVPSSVQQEEYGSNPLAMKGNLIQIKRARCKSGSDAEPLLNKPQIDQTPVSVDEASVPISNDTHVMDITYCRFLDGSYCHRATHGTKDVTEFMMLYDSEVLRQQNGKQPLAKIEFEWEYSMYPMLGYYCIEIADIHNVYTEVGVTSLPCIEVEGLPLEYILKIRVHAKLGLLSGITSNLCITFDFNDDPGPNGDLVIGEMGLFHQLYDTTGGIIGKGAFGEVSLVRRRGGRNPQYYAAKFIKLRTPKRTQSAEREFHVMASLSHPELVRMVGAFMTCKQMVFVMEYLCGGELCERIVEEENIKEVDVVPYVRQICEGLEYLHRKRIVHLDIKPENIICCHPNSWGIKIIDFGLARELVEGQPMRALYGTRSYIAPEILNYDILSVACDMWSLGVVTYVLLSGCLPFTGDEWPEYSRNIQRGDYNYNDPAFSDVTNRARSFIDQLLVVNPRARMTATEALAHPWINTPYVDAMKVPMKLTKQNLKNYLATHARWQRVRNVLGAAFRFKFQGGLRQIQEQDGT